MALVITTTLRLSATGTSASNRLENIFCTRIERDSGDSGGSFPAGEFDRSTFDSIRFTQCDRLVSAVYQLLFASSVRCDAIQILIQGRNTPKLHYIMQGPTADYSQPVLIHRRVRLREPHEKVPV
ncbi:hypothetical protein BJY00DRAFT_192822 [Aspergillus carlsbadensis]|nr:hypothetical protein BJY00DRAFT_192822 [Aspergillus carlsbadensis]